MESKVSISPPIPEPEVGAPPRNPVPAQQAERVREAKPEAPDLRLVIEENPQAGTFVYKTIDRRTGEVVAQVPREEVLRMRESPDYMAGDVIRTEA